MAEKTVHEAVWTLIQSLQETNQAITESLVASQERNRRLAESFFTDGMEVFKTNETATESLVTAQEGNSARWGCGHRTSRRDMREHEVDILTIGQYLRPSFQHLPIQRYVPLEEFAVLKAEGKKMGFRHVESGPLVRSSYHAHEQADGVSRERGES